jgi:hypothetical protein
LRNVGFGKADAKGGKKENGGLWAIYWIRVRALTKVLINVSHPLLTWIQFSTHVIPAL